MKTVDIIYRYEAQDTPARSRPSDSEAALLRLGEGNRAFAALLDGRGDGNGFVQRVVPVDLRDLGILLGDAAAPRQRPFAAILGCSDARAPVELIFNEGPNDLFVIRVAGNGLGEEVLGSLKYAVDHLSGSLKLIVVQASARKLLETFGPDIAHDPGYRQALIEASIVTNAAFAAYTIQQEFGSSDPTGLRAVYGVYLLETRQVWAPRVSEMK